MPELGELLLRAETREQHQTRGVDSTGTQNGLLLGAQGVLDTGLQSHVDTGDGIALHVHLGNPGVGEDGQVRTLLITAQNGVNIGDTGAAAAAVIRIVGDVEEADSLGQLTLVADVVVEVLNDGNVHGAGAGLDPVLAQLVAVAGMHRLEGVAQVVNDAGEGLKVPALAALGHPVTAIILERTEGDQSVVGGATTEDLRAGVTDMAVTCGVVSKDS